MQGVDTFEPEPPAKRSPGWEAAIQAWWPDKWEQGQVPYLAKDLFDIKGHRTTASSVFLQKVREPAREDAAIVRLLAESGATCVGKTHLNEFAYGLSGENSHYGDVPHPHLPGALAGGSSSGSAWAVAKGIVPFALGTDTGGSIRVPAAFCGLYGFRAVPGWMTEGCFPLAPSFDTVGWFTREKTFMIQLLEDLLPHCTVSPVKPVAVIDRDWLSDEGISQIYRESAEQRSLEVDEALSAEVSRQIQDLPAAFNILQSREAFRIHEPWLDEWRDQYDPATLSRIERGRGWSDEEIEWARGKVREWKIWIEDLLKDGLTLWMPAIPRPSPPRQELTSAFREKLLALTVPASIAGFPVLTHPVPLAEGGSLGWQEISTRMEGFRLP